METKALTRWDVQIGSDYMVVGTDPENAWMDNPRGEIVGERFYMRASNAYGDCFRWGLFETLEQCEAAYVLFAPPAPLLWEATYPAYGSPAYEEYGAADEIAWEKELDGRRF